MGIPQHSYVRSFLMYGVMIVGAVLAFQGLVSVGGSLEAPAPASNAASHVVRAKLDVLPHVLIALLVIIVLARALGALFQYFHQPAVIGEVIAGIVLGPSLLGRLAPEAAAFVLPPDIAPFLGVLAQVGVILFMLTVGLELDTRLLRERTHATVIVSHASIIVPFVLGGGLALLLYPRLATADVSFETFALFIGVAMSVTAFPVLARILTDRGISTSRLGVVALTCAAVDDVTAWCLLGLVVGVVKAESGNGLLIAVKALAYIAFMLVLVRPLLVRIAKAQEPRQSIGQGVIALLFGITIVSALLTDWIGIHALFGAFLVGALVPHESRLAREMDEKMRDLVVVFLLPAFFAFTGMRMQVSLVSGGVEWLLCGLIIVVASLGKFGGSTVAGRLTGMQWRDAAALGILMNTRGLVELIVLNIGYDLGVISPTLFAMLVIMALVTTAATTPILHLLTRRQYQASHAADLMASGTASP
jgi:Kef-type K+ transport system membrane component KefB